MAPACTTGLTPRGVALFLLCGLAAPAQAAEDAGTPQTIVSPFSEEVAGLFDFDIPAQSLATALQRYALISGRPALFSSAMAAGRSAAAVRGRYTQEAALNILLEGSGLVAQPSKGGPADAFVLKLLDARAGAGHPVMNGLDIDYGGWVQARVWDALCADARTAPGGYRVLLRFGVDAAGYLRQARLLTSTGSKRRDAAVLDILEHVRVDRSPPPDMAQPLTMILLPRDVAHPDGRSCDGNGNSGKPGGAS